MKNFFGTKLKAIRSSLGLSQRDFANMLKTSSGYISELENGIKQPGYEILIELKQKLNVKIDTLIPEIAEPTSDKDIITDKLNALKKMMIDHNVKKVDIKNYFGWSWTYTTLLFNSKLAYLTDVQIKRITDALPIIQKTKAA